MKISGFQITTSSVIQHLKGTIRDVFYVEHIKEITVDTDKGSFIINEKDLLEILKKVVVL